MKTVYMKIASFGKKAIGRVLLTLVTTISLAKCGDVPESSLASPREVQVVLPALPQACKDEMNLYWRLSWYDSGGNPHSMDAQNGNILLEIEATSFTPITAFPVIEWQQPGNDPKAGAFFPADCLTQGDTTTIHLSWLAGPAAECAETVIRGAIAGSRTGQRIAEFYNWKKLIAKLALRGENGKTLAHCPAKLSRETVAAAILGGKPNANDVDFAPTAQVAVVLPAGFPPAKRFWSTCPFAELPDGECPHHRGFTASPGESVRLELEAGVHRYRCDVGCLVVTIDEAGRANAFLRP
jgi:hypothetical protein